MDFTVERNERFSLCFIDIDSDWVDTQTKRAPFEFFVNKIAQLQKELIKYLKLKHTQLTHNKTTKENI